MNNFWRRLTAASAFVAASGGALAAEKVVFGLTVPLGAQYSDIAFGKQLGFFEEEGIDISIVPFQGAPVVTAQVANKTVDFAFGDLIFSVVTLSKDSGVPVKFVYNYQRSTIHNVVVPAESNIKSIADLKGKKVGIFTLSAASVTLTKSVLASEGILNDVTLVPVGLGPAAWKQMQSGNVDALNFWASEDAKMKAAGVNVRHLTYPAQYQPIFSSGVIAHVDTIEKKPELVAKIGRILAKSSVACKAAVEACARSFWALDPTSKPSPDKEEEWVRNTVTLLDAQSKSIHDFFGDKVSWGSFPPAAFEGAKKVLGDANLLVKTDMDPNAIITNQFVPQFNDFDTKAVQAKALEAQKKTGG
jgi:NitT/TauT family transport system substrate-binding protein